MNSFSYFLFGKLFIYPPILDDSSSGQRNLGYGSLLFMTLNISCQSILACKVSFEKLADSDQLTEISLWELPQVSNLFPLAAFKILTLSLTFGFLMMMCLGVGLFVSILFGTLWTCMPISFTKLGKFLSLFFFNKLSISRSFSFPPGTPMM